MSVTLMEAKRDRVVLLSVPGDVRVFWSSLKWMGFAVVCAGGCEGISVIFYVNSLFCNRMVSPCGVCGRLFVSMAT